MEGFAEVLDKRAARLLEEWAGDLQTKVSVPVATQSRIGSAGAQILAALDDDKTFGLVVMGSHGRSGLRRALLGSLAEKVVRHAGRPVPIARARSEKQMVRSETPAMASAAAVPCTDRCVPIPELRCSAGTY